MAEGEEIPLRKMLLELRETAAAYDYASTEPGRRTERVRELYKKRAEILHALCDKIRATASPEDQEYLKRYSPGPNDFAPPSPEHLAYMKDQRASGG